MSRLQPEEARTRAARVALVLCDNDGTLTDGRVYYSARGEELKAYSLRDGMGVERLREQGIATAIITREISTLVERRAEKLALRWCWTGIRDKRAQLGEISAETGLSPDRIAFLGDDVNDLGVIEELSPVGLTGAPVDALPQVKQAVHYVTETPGGHGAFREFAEWLLALRGPVV